MRFWVTGLAILLGLTVMVDQLLLDPDRFPVREIQVQGSLEYLERTELEQELSGHVSGNLLRLDMRELEHHLIAHPWVAEAWVRRDWPATLQVQVLEEEPIARWAAGGFVTDSGKHIRPSRELDLSLVLLEAPDDRAVAMVELLGRLQAMLHPHGLALRAVQESRNYSLGLTLENGMVLTLGREEPLARLQRWLRYRQALIQVAPQAIEIDLRYPNGFAVRSKELTPQTQQARSNL